MSSCAAVQNIVPEDQLELAQVIRQRSAEAWGTQKVTEIVGAHPSIERVLERTSRFAASTAPVLITGETGTGKELFARALYLLSARLGQAFLTINCAQYQEGQLIASELFGHRRGSFTGAVTDHKGIFESAAGGVVFLDEVGELSLSTQAMLLRLLSEGEIIPVGEARSRRVDVRVVAATNRDLKKMVEEGRFRADLFYRLRSLQLCLPPLRDRGNDWRLIVEHDLSRLGAARRPAKRFSPQALSLLEHYRWPGNVREVRGLVDTGYNLSNGPTIEVEDFQESLDDASSVPQVQPLALIPRAEPDGLAGPRPENLLARLLDQEGTFWTLVHQPYLDRELNRSQVRELISQGLERARGSYKRLLDVFGLRPEEYLKLMDFLRHHNLKPGH